MAKKEKAEKGEQLPLIDVAPENAKPIIAAARLYKKHQKARLASLKEEIGQKQKILSLVKEANLTTLEGGKIRFKYDGVTISITPRDELVKVKENGEDEPKD